MEERCNMSVEYPLKFKAAILERNHESLVIDGVTFTGPLLPGQVLVRINYSGICGKQIEEINASAGPDRFLPHMLGHEGSGVVVDVGPGVKTVKVDDHVVLHWLKGQGIDAETPIYTRNGQRVNAGWITTFNEYGVISENRLTVIPNEADLKTASLLGCAVTTGLGVIINEANVRPGESVAVFGCGGVGLNAIQGAALVNAYPIIAVDKNPESLQIARQLGATDVIQTNADVICRIRQLTKDEGADVVIIAVANPQAIELAIEAAAAPGRVFLAAVPPAGARVSLDALDIHRKKKLDGSYGGGTVPERDIGRYLGLYERGLLRLNELISHTVSLEEINKGVKFVTSGTIGRCIVKMSE